MAKHTQKQSACDPLNPLTLIQNYDLIRQEKDDGCRIAMMFLWRAEVLRLFAHSPELKGSGLHPDFQAIKEEMQH